MTQVETAAYVRPAGDMLPERTPPASSQGLTAWIRQNLFGNLTDSIITVLLAVFLCWFIWSSISFLFVRANWSGVTQGEATMAEVVADLDSQLKEAEHKQNQNEAQADGLIREVELEFSALARLIRVLRLEDLPTNTRLGMTTRILPEDISQRFEVAKTKVPFSRALELEILQRQLLDPSITQQPDLSPLALTEAEEAGLRQASKPWTRATDAQKETYQAAWTAAKKIINANEKLEGADGKTYVPMAQVRMQLSDLVANLSIDSEPIDSTQLFERPTKIAREFNKAVDGVMGAFITNIPQSRVQKIRKDFVGSDEVARLKKEAAFAMVQADNPDLSGRRLNDAVKAAEATVTDASLFLQRAMPEGFEDPLPSKLREALDDVQFWEVAEVLSDPRAILTGDGEEESFSGTSTRGAALNPQSATSSDGLTTVQKAPLALAGLETLGTVEGAYGKTTQAMLAAYANQDIPAMAEALNGVEPLTQWAGWRNGANWAILRNFEKGEDNNWNRMLIGTYTPNKVWHLFDPDVEGWKLNEKIWRIWLAAAGLIVALLPLFVPATRNRFFYLFSAIYPLFLFFMLAGLSIRFYGFEGREVTKLYIALIAILYIIAAYFVRSRTSFGKTAGPALLVSQVIALGIIVLTIWGNVINPSVSKKGLLVNENFIGFLSEDHPLGEKFNPDLVQAEIDALTLASNEDGIAADERQALRTQAQSLKTDLTAAKNDQKLFKSVVEDGRGTYIVLPLVPSLQWGGLLVTMVLGVVGMAASLPIGIVLAFGRQSTLPIVRWFSTGLIEITRGVPLIALLLVVTFVLPKLLPAGVEYPKLALVLGAICLFGGVYQAEVIRGGLQSLPKGQYEASQALGLTFWQESRLISLPQALKAVIPAIVNTFIGLFKDTTLVIVVGIVDLLTAVEFQITAENAWNTTKLEALIVVSLIFFVLMFSLSRYSIWLEKRLATGHN